MRAKKHEMTNFLFILHIILACSEQVTHSVKNVTSDRVSISSGPVREESVQVGKSSVIGRLKHASYLTSPS